MRSRYTHTPVSKQSDGWKQSIVIIVYNIFYINIYAFKHFVFASDCNLLSWAYCNQNSLWVLSNQSVAYDTLKITCSFFLFFVPACISGWFHSHVWVFRLQRLLTREYSKSGGWRCRFNSRKEYCHGGLWWSFYDISDEQNKVFWRREMELFNNIERLFDWHGTCINFGVFQSWPAAVYRKLFGANITIGFSFYSTAHRISFHESLIVFSLTV